MKFQLQVRPPSHSWHAINRDHRLLRLQELFSVPTNGLEQVLVQCQEQWSRSQLNFRLIINYNMDWIGYGSKLRREGHRTKYGTDEHRYDRPTWFEL